MAETSQAWPSPQNRWPWGSKRVLLERSRRPFCKEKTYIHFWKKIEKYENSLVISCRQHLLFSGRGARIEERDSAVTLGDPLSQFLTLFFSSLSYASFCFSGFCLKELDDVVINVFLNKSIQVWPGTHSLCPGSWKSCSVTAGRHLTAVASPSYSRGMQQLRAGCHLW